MSDLDLTIGDMVGRERITIIDDEDVRIDFVKRGEFIHIESYYKTMQAVFDENASLAADFSRNTKLSTMERVAHIPNGLYYKWAEEGIMDEKERLVRRLNDSDYSKVRTNSLVV